MQQKDYPGQKPEANDLPGANPPGKQLLNKKAEEYLRESGNIEDLPDEKEDEEALRATKEHNKQRRKE